MRTAAIYVASALLVWFALRWVTPVARYELLQSSGVRVTGNVVSTTCGNHGSFSYQYFAQGQQIRASGKSSAGGLSCDSLSPGLSIPVVYLASSPAESVAGNPALALSEARLFAVGAALLFPAIALWLIHRRRTQESVA
jgi:hypothetical protein